jgi:hypothetical protein
MRVFLPRLLVLILAAAFLPSIHAQAPDNFRWIDFHAQADQDVVIWVTRALTVEKWTAIREIGVEYDSALVVTTERATPQSAVNADAFTVWNVSLTDHALTPLLKGVNLRMLDWMLLSQGRPRELAAFYDNCVDCSPSTYFTAFHYDVERRAWVARWIHGDQAAPAWSAAAIAGIASLDQAYAVLAQPDGREYLATWRHFDFGKDRKAEDYVYVYDVDQFSGQDHTQLLTGKQADDLMQHLCRAQDAVQGLARGQDSPLCQPAVKSRPERHPVTTPPANNRGKSVPPGSKPQPPKP